MVELVAFVSGRRGFTAPVWVVDAAVGATAVVFASVKLSPVLASVWSHLIGFGFYPFRVAAAAVAAASIPELTPVVVRADSTDLMALVALCVPWRLARRRSVAAAV